MPKFEFVKRLMMKYYIAIDLGATSGRVILAAATADGKVEMETLHRFPTPLVEKDGRYYWDINSIFSDILEGLKIAGGRGVRVESIGIDTWGVDFAGIGKDGSLTGLPRSYRDPYSFAAQDAFFQKMTREELYDRTGIQIMNFNSVFQLYAQSLAGELDEADKILFIPDLLSYMLTGEMVCEYTILSTSALMNPRTKELDPDVLSVCGLDKSRFARLVYPGDRVGTLKPEYAASTGLGEVQVKAVAGHDTASAVAAVPAKGRNFAYLSSGTWSLMGIEVRQPVISSRMFEMNYTNEGGAGGTITLLKNITGMWLLEQCLSKWKEEGRTYSYDEVRELAVSSPSPGCVIDPDAKEFASPTDMPEAIRSWCRSHGMPVPADDAAVIRLIYESLAARYAEVFKALEQIAGHTIDVLHIIGGGSRNGLLNQMTADACGVTVIAGPAEGTALGNVMVQTGLPRERIAGNIETKTYTPDEQGL